MNRADLLARMKAKRLSAETITWSQFASAVQNLSTAQKNSLMALLNSGKADEAGSLVVGLATTLRKDQASVYVEAKAADDTWTTDELLELLSD